MVRVPAAADSAIVAAVVAAVVATSRVATIMTPVVCVLGLSSLHVAVQGMHQHVEDLHGEEPFYSPKH